MASAVKSSWMFTISLFNLRISTLKVRITTSAAMMALPLRLEPLPVVPLLLKIANALKKSMQPTMLTLAYSTNA